MSNPIRISGDRPLPFIFCSKNYALAKYGSFINGSYTAGVASINSSYPASHMIDGNRSSFCQFEKIGHMSPSGGSNYMDVKFDIAASGFNDNTENQIDFIVIENDPNYPMRNFKITSYTDSNFSVGAQSHNHSYPYYYTSPFAFYARGIWNLVDGKRVYSRQNQDMPDGLDGRYILVTLDDPISYDRPYIKISFRGVGRNVVGWDGTFDNGLWYGAVDEVLSTSDPINDFGTNNNHMKLFTDSGTGGHQQDQLSRTIQWATLDDATYLFQYNTKRIGFSSIYGYQTTITYYSNAGSSLGTYTLSKHFGMDSSWTRERHFINYFDPIDAKRKSGDNPAGRDCQHEVPDGAKSFAVRFKLEYDSSFKACEYKIDDVAIHNCSNIPARASDFETFTYAGILLNMPNYIDMSGTAKIKRIGFHQFEVATSKTKGAQTPTQDLSGFATGNPITVSDSELGKAVLRNANGRIMTQFVPRSGIKVERVLSMIGSSAWKNFISDLHARTEAFGMIDSQCNFSDFIVSPGSITWNTAGQEESLTPEGNSTGSISWREAPDFLWQGTFTLKEV